MRTRVLGALVLAPLLALAPPARAQDPGCVGETDAAAVEKRPAAHALRVGITPGVQTGQLATGAAPPRTPEDPRRQLEALAKLRPAHAPFVLRLHRFFWSDGEEGIQRFLALADRYTSAGYLVELQLRYHPNAEQEGDIEAWKRHVRDVVRRFGPNPRVVAIQVTNEVNLTFSPDSSDGAYENARDALVQGVVAAQDERRKRGFDQLEIGFNWAYRMDPAQEQSFWNGVRDRGGKAFVDAVDWVGLDAYPGTFFPPAHTPGGEPDGMVNAMESIRCYLRTPGIPDSVPIHIEENGWPTGPHRPESEQVRVAEALIRTVHDFRGTYNVTDYRWFNLRDGDSTSGNHQTQYGLLRDDYGEKPAFATVARLFAELGRRDSAAPAPDPAAGAGASTRRPRVSLRQRCRRDGRIRVRVTARRRIARVGFLPRRRLVFDRRRPFARTVRPQGRRVIAFVVFGDGGAVTVSRRARRCRDRR